MDTPTKSGMRRSFTHVNANIIAPANTDNPAARNIPDRLNPMKNSKSGTSSDMKEPHLIGKDDMIFYFFRMDFRTCRSIA